jgi:hypothetical protein
LENGVLSTMKKHWHLVVGVVAILSWFTSQVVTASATLSDVNDSIQNNQEKIVDLESDLDKHQEGDGHPQLSERLIRVETEVIHINRTQSQSFQDIKTQLNVMQDDIKDINRKQHEH